jgi:hypothetical protein
MPSTYEPIATTTLTSAQTSVSFTSISSAYTDIVIVLSVRDATNGYLLVRYNNDSNSNYSRSVMYGDGSNPQAFRQTNQTSHFIATGGSNNEGQLINVNNYSNATTYKTTLFRDNTAGSSVAAQVGLYRSTSAITQIDFISPNGTATIASGSTFTLYGIKAA